MCYTLKKILIYNFFFTIKYIIININIRIKSKSKYFSNKIELGKQVR